MDNDRRLVWILKRSVVLGLTSKSNMLMVQFSLYLMSARIDSLKDQPFEIELESIETG